MKTLQAPKWISRQSQTRILSHAPQSGRGLAQPQRRSAHGGRALLGCPANSSDAAPEGGGSWRGCSVWGILSPSRYCFFCFQGIDPSATLVLIKQQFDTLLAICYALGL